MSTDKEFDSMLSELESQEKGQKIKGIMILFMLAVGIIVYFGGTIMATEYIKTSILETFISH